MIGLHNRIQPYAWGSRTAIAALQGRAVPAPEPEAELWLGAHQSAPSVVDGLGVSLLDVIAGDPHGTLGSPVVARFGARLPYLLKVLAAAEPLSLQAHPDAAQAAAGYALGRSSYADPNHKPELLVALEPFDALCGFRDPAVTAKLLESFGVAELTPVVDALRVASQSEALRGAVGLLLDWPTGTRADLVAAVAAAGAELRDSAPDVVFERAYGLVGDLAARYPSDVGVVVALLLNHLVLQPGEAVFMPAGNLHAYLRGTGIEIMAASDNVLRGGLTPKPVDVTELTRILRYEVLTHPLVRPVEFAPGLSTWRAPVTDFRLLRARPGDAGVVLPGSGPRILLCVRGPVELISGDAEAVSLRPGESVFVTAGEPPVEVRGPGAEVFQAAVNL